MFASAQERVIIDICTVPSGHGREMINELLTALEEFRVLDGFIEAGLLPNRDKTKVAWYLRMRSREAAERAEVRHRIRALESIGGSHADAFERAWVIAPPMESGPTEVSYGAF